MSIDERDYMYDRDWLSTSAQQKRRPQIENPRRFEKATNQSGRIAGRSWKQYLFKVLVWSILVTPLTHMQQISSWFLLRQSMPQFPATGAVRWSIPTAAIGSVAPLVITGSIGRNIVVKLDTWDTHIPIVMIPIRSGESVTLQVPLGRYLVTYAQNAIWQGEFKLTGEKKEVVAPLIFYQNGNQFVGNNIDLNERVNGNLEIRDANYF